MHRKSVAHADAIAPAFGMETFHGERRGGVDVNPVILRKSVHMKLIEAELFA